MFLDALLDTFIDGMKLLPFLFITYLVMEYVEHKAGNKAATAIKKSGKLGPALGSILGVVPQCGFSAAASNLYAGRIITIGTLIAIFLSTSDEMLPILISEQVNPVVIVKILAVKVVIGMIAGFFFDFIVYCKRGEKQEELRIEHMCDHQHCHCSDGKIWKSALSHTIQIFVFIFVISLVLNLIIGFAGEDKLAALISSKPVLGPMVAALIGLIPNCAASVVITQLYLEGVLSTGAMLAGLLTGSGVGLLVLFKVNDDWKDNLKIALSLYVIGVIVGIAIELFKITF